MKSKKSKIHDGVDKFLIELLEAKKKIIQMYLMIRFLHIFLWFNYFLKIGSAMEKKCGYIATQLFVIFNSWNFINWVTCLIIIILKMFLFLLFCNSYKYTLTLTRLSLTDVIGWVFSLKPKTQHLLDCSVPVTLLFLTRAMPAILNVNLPQCQPFKNF